jgi:hypothetical protein
MMKCWDCNQKMVPSTNGAGEVVNRCVNCGRATKPIPRKRPGQSDSPYQDNE